MRWSEIPLANPQFPPPHDHRLTRSVWSAAARAQAANPDFPPGRDESCGDAGKSGFATWARRRRFGISLARRRVIRNHPDRKQAYQRPPSDQLAHGLPRRCSGDRSGFAGMSPGGLSLHQPAYGARNTKAASARPHGENGFPFVTLRFVSIAGEIRFHREVSRRSTPKRRPKSCTKRRFPLAITL